MASTIDIEPGTWVGNVYIAGTAGGKIVVAGFSKWPAETAEDIEEAGQAYLRALRQQNRKAKRHRKRFLDQQDAENS